MNKIVVHNLQINHLIIFIYSCIYNQLTQEWTKFLVFIMFNASAKIQQKQCAPVEQISGINFFGHEHCNTVYGCIMYIFHNNTIVYNEQTTGNKEVFE